MTGSTGISETLRKLEEQLQTSSVRANATAVASMLTEEFREFGSSGHIFSKIETIHALRAESVMQITMRDFQAVLLSEEIALVTYRAIREQAGSLAVESLRSSLWIFREGRWQMYFHQGTKLSEVRE